MTFRLFLAYSVAARKTMIPWDWKNKPLNILVALPYIDAWEKIDALPARTILDSGAYSAWNSGKEIDIDQLIAESKKPQWDETVSLDVIGDSEASMKNALYMKAKGASIFPVFHIGDPWEMLREYCLQFERVGLSCRFGEGIKESMRWLEQCFAREWPHNFHSFGWVSRKMLMTYPFATVDTASYVRAPMAWGRWKSFKSLPLGALKGGRNFSAEVEWYLSLEREVQRRWRKALEEIPYCEVKQ